MAVGLCFCARCLMTLIFAFVRSSALGCNNVTPSSTTKVSVPPGKGACSRSESD